MNRSYTSLRICYFGTLAISLIVVILRSVAMFCCYDADSGYFDSGALLPILCNLLSVVAVILPLACALLMPKQDVASMKACMQPALARHGATAIVPTAVIATASILCFVLFARNFNMTTDPITGNSKLPAYLTLLVCIAISGICTALFYATRLGLKLGTVATTCLGFVAIVWTVLTIGYTYFYFGTALNLPVKMALQFGLMGAMLSLTAEIRVVLDRYAPRSGMFFHSLAVFFGYTASIPTLITHFAGSKQSPLHIIWTFAVLGIAIYETVQLIRLTASYDGTAPAYVEVTPTAHTDMDTTPNPADQAETPMSGGES